MRIASLAGTARESGPGRFGPLPDDTLIARGLWQYAHYYDPAPG
jgi:hypothetical protein